MKNTVCWDVTPCGSYKNRRFGGTCCLHCQGDIVFLRSALRFLVTANVDPSSSIIVTLMMEALRSFEMSVIIRATRRNIQEGDFLHSHGRENLYLTWH
jgi:hypothetical protein